MPQLEALLNNRQLIPSDPGDYRGLLQDLQCNVLTPHRRTARRLYFVRFQGGEGGLWRTRYLLAMLGSTAAQRANVLRRASDVARHMPTHLARRFRLRRGDGPLFATHEEFEQLRDFYLTSELEVRSARDRRDPGPDFVTTAALSAAGYRALGEEPPPEQAFLEGAKRRAARLGDPDPSEWSEALAQDHHLLVSVAYNVDLENDPRLDTFDDFIHRHASVHLERGASIEIGGRMHEPFGFRDGLSQPRFYGADLQSTAARAADAVPLRVALVPDPGGQGEHSCGTYLVFRKIEQDVERFYGQVAALAAKLGKSEDDVAQGLVGRQFDGTPLVASKRAGNLNAFDYSGDPDGAGCPFHAHIRKTNPRADIHPSWGGASRRIVRRGIPYGPALEREGSRPCLRDGKVRTVGGGPSTGVGLLFECAQASIEGQFEVIQHAWASNRQFPPHTKPGPDPIIGRSVVGTPNRIREGNRYVDFPSCTALLGAGYFFLPSISFFQHLCDFNI